MKKSLAFGNFIKEKRGELGKTLRSFCKEHNLDPAWLSRVERGLLPPPTGRKLKTLGEQLEIESGTKEWQKFESYAAASRGVIPDELNEEEETVKRLAVFFRLLRGQEVEDKELDDFKKAMQEVVFGKSKPRSKTARSRGRKSR